ncbi:MAG TPA: DUF1987 domain-containing protein [Alphaproteobacteria bacterium]|nr:DUF1987 domain-containing protein [Alphaproteobacteria bacterium]
MENLKIAAGERSPEIDFDFAARRLAIRGESYPEDVAAFYGPVQDALDSFLARLDGPLTVEIELIYFNSSSAKALMNLFQALERAAARGPAVTLRWLYDAEDDTMKEFGEDFAEDFEKVRFELAERP